MKLSKLFLLFTMKYGGLYISYSQPKYAESMIPLWSIPHLGSQIHLYLRTPRPFYQISSTICIPIRSLQWKEEDIHSLLSTWLAITLKWISMVPWRFVLWTFNLCVYIVWGTIKVAPVGIVQFAQPLPLWQVDPDPTWSTIRSGCSCWIMLEVTIVCYQEPGLTKPDVTICN